MNTRFVRVSPGAKMLRGLVIAASVLFILTGTIVRPALAAAQFDLVGPAGSGKFGYQVLELPNGNLVVADPEYSSNTTSKVGAVYLYNGATRALISVLTGSQTGDLSTVITWLLNSENFLVWSSSWANGDGEVTLCSVVTGCSGEISASNSLVGSQLGEGGFNLSVSILRNGNYVVFNPNWDNGKGAVTWCSGVTGCVGSISASNSLVGSQAGDHVGDGSAWPRITLLANGNYVVISHYWANGAAVEAGAVTWCSGTSGCSGPVSASNSLIGSQAHDWVDQAIELSDGNYVVNSSAWANAAAAQAGAVTWCSGTTGCKGTISPSNSLVGGQAYDHIGSGTPGTLNGIMPLSNGGYVVISPDWDNGTASDAGAVTGCSGTGGCTGPVSASNSLVGSHDSERLGDYDQIVKLTNGNYVVANSDWNNGATLAVGSVTWCSGTTGCKGTISASNSLVGSHEMEQIGARVVALTNGNYVVGSPGWINAAASSVGAVTWCNGNTGCTGLITASNSLVGSQEFDSVGSHGVIPLSNGNYVVSSANWKNGTIGYAGAVTWCNGSTGCTGPVTASNSLVGSQENDFVGSTGVFPLDNGNYVVFSSFWANGPVLNAGAVTWCSGTSGCTGPVTASNSLVGSQANDEVGSLGYNKGFGITQLQNGNYVVISPEWKNESGMGAGAVTWCNGAVGCRGAVSSGNSLVGNLAINVADSKFVPLINGNYLVVEGWSSWTTSTVAITLCYGKGPNPTGPISSTNSFIGTVSDFAYDYVNSNLIVGRADVNTVSFFKSFFMNLYLPVTRK